MKDGYYTAEAAEFDEHGWKEYVTICVSGGQIILIEYNAYNPTGLVKSWDMDYMRIMNAVDGTYPNAYTRMYGRQFLDRQSADVDCISGATNSYYSFVRLAGAVLENARSGDSTARQVNLAASEASGRVEH
jgi:major membrane immunogen (membrane-anchored lipoprotein)